MFMDRRRPHSRGRRNEDWHMTTLRDELRNQLDRIHEMERKQNAIMVGVFVGVAIGVAGFVWRLVIGA